MPPVLVPQPEILHDGVAHQVFLLESRLPFDHLLPVADNQQSTNWQVIITSTIMKQCLINTGDSFKYNAENDLFAPIYYIFFFFSTTALLKELVSNTV